MKKVTWKTEAFLIIMIKFPKSREPWWEEFAVTASIWFERKIKLSDIIKNK